MNSSLVSFQVESFEKVPDDRAGLKDVYVLSTPDGKRVFSQDNGTGWNWLTGVYTEPLVINWVCERAPELAPEVIEMNLDEKWMVTEFVGEKDMLEILDIAGKDEYEEFGHTLGEVHSLEEFDGFGGLEINENGALEPQHDNWNETLASLIENRSTPPQDTNGNPIDDVMGDAFRELNTDIVPCCFSHGDFNPRNVRIDGQNNIVSLVDWQNAWVSDGLSEFFYRRLRIASNPPETDAQTAAFTGGYRRSCPVEVLGITDAQATASYLTALARAYDWTDGEIEAEPVFEKYGTLENTLSLETLLGSGRASHLSTYEE